MTGTIEEIWILAFDGTHLMIAAMRRPDVTHADVAELAAILGSPRIET